MYILSPDLDNTFLKVEGRVSLKCPGMASKAMEEGANKSIVPHHTSAATHNSAEESAMHH